MRGLFLLSAAALVAAAVTLPASGAGSTAVGPTATGAARSLAVSVPPDPIAFKPGQAETVTIRVLNPNPKQMTATISQRGLSFGDNGKTTMGTTPDPRWRGLRFPTAPIVIPAEGYRNVPLHIQLPKRIAPDLYFIGFLITPTQTSVGNLQVVNQIGSFLTVDVAGPRIRRLNATFELPSFVFGSHVSGTLEIKNTGRTVVRYWGENDTTASPGGGFSEQRLDPSLLPVGAARLTTVTGKPRWPIGRVTMTVHLIYPGRTESATDELTFKKQVLVISPVVPGGVGVLLLGGVAGILFGRRRRRARLA